MDVRGRRWMVLAGLLCACLAARAGDSLSVVKAGPEGEIATLHEADEVRVLFSEPMVELGRIPDPVRAPFFHIRPAIPGTFRWSGTRLLIFTPDHADELPYCAKYTVSVDATATSVDGRTLGTPFTFAFTTPTVRLLNAQWMRKTGRYDSPAVLALRFNQPVDPKAVAAHASLRYARHDWEVPVVQKEVMARMAKEDPQAFMEFQKKVARAALAANATAPVAFALAKSWDEKRFPPGDDLVVLETTTVPPPQSQVHLELDGLVPGAQGPETPGAVQPFDFFMEPAFFVNGLHCSRECSVEFYNAVELRSRVSVKDLAASLRVLDVTEPDKESTVAVAPPDKGEPAPDEDVEGDDEAAGEGAWADISLDQLGLKLQPARTYLFKVSRGLKSSDGQVLGYDWYGQVEYWHKSALLSFGAGHGVWEASGGSQLPFSLRNYTSLKEWAKAVGPEDLVADVLRVDGLERLPDGRLRRLSPEQMLPDGAPRLRAFQPEPDVIQSLGLDLKGFLDPEGRGLVFAGLQGVSPLPRSFDTHPSPAAALIQVTNLGISVKDSPQNTVVLVTRLDDGAPVEGATVAIRTLDGTVFWQGQTGRDGVAVAPDTDLRRGRLRFEGDDDNPRRDEDDYGYWWEMSSAPRFVVTAALGGDTAYVASDWNEGVEPWTFNVNYDLNEAKPQLRGAVFPDRGVYKLGEEVHFKVILRSDTARGMAMLPAGTKAKVVLKDSHSKQVDERDVPLSEWSGADWAVKIPEDGPLGSYGVQVTVDGQRGSAYRSFLVAAYRKPDFRVDANVGSADDLAGATLQGAVTGRYLFGAPMAGRPVKLTYSKSPLAEVPKAVDEKYSTDRFAFLQEAWRGEGGEDRTTRIFQRDATLGPDGAVRVDLPTDLKAGKPYAYTLEGEVTDVSRQTIAGRASFPVHPAPWYLGLKRPSFFVEAKDGLHTELVAVTPRGEAAAGVHVSLSLIQVQWNSVRRSEGGGMYTWETRRVEKERWKGDAQSGSEPVQVDVPIPEGGYYILAATASDAQGRSTTTDTDFYALGAGYTAWERYDSNRIDLVPEKKTYRPGESARVMIKSPWEKATALLTTEREGVRTHEVFQLTSTMQTVTVPISEADIPNVYVSVLLVKGRTSTVVDKEGADPGKPAFKLGYVELKVEDAGKRLSVEVSSDKEEYRPQDTARIDVDLKDSKGAPVSGEVTLWAVDYGVLSLTGYKTPDVLDSVWVEKALQVANEDSRQMIVSRRVLTPKGAEEGGGGGYDEGVENKARKDFRVLAFWLGSAVTGRDGRLTTRQKLPESLTTYRIMAVAQDRSHRFGWGQREIRLSKPVLLTPAFPRFLALGDKAYFGAVVHSRLQEPGSAMVTLKSLTPGLLAVQDGVATVDVPAKGASEARFHVEAKGVGTARLLMTVKLSGEEDAFELPLPVRLLASPEVVAAYGTAAPDAQESLALPEGVVPGVGGLHVELSSTAMVGLGEGARYLVDYPYGCAEQKASSALALLLASDLGDAFELPGIKPEELRAVTQKTLKDLEAFQCADGGFVYWKGGCPWTSPYLTSYVVHVYQRARKLGYAVSDDVVRRACDYLQQRVGASPPPNEAYMPAYTAWQAFAVKVLAEEGRAVDGHLTRLYGYRDRMPVFGLCALWDAMVAGGERGARPEDLRRRVRNAVLPEGGSAHVEELADPYLLWFWNSNTRSTAIALGSLVRDGDDAALVPGMVRWLMAARKEGRWGNTQENAWAMESLVDYYRKYEAEVPDFTGVAALGLKTLLSADFKGRDTSARAGDTPMAALLASGRAGASLPLTFKREGTGTLFYVARLKYASDQVFQAGLDVGIAVKRRYEPMAGGAASLSYKAGDLVRVVLDFDLTKERRWVAVEDPIPAGFEPVESWFATTAGDLTQDQEGEESQRGDWMAWWRKGGFDHVERHDDRVLLFATRLSEGHHTFRYICRATTAGTFRTAPCHAEEMYEPEVFGRTATDVVEVKE